MSALNNITKGHGDDDPAASIEQTEANVFEN